MGPDCPSSVECLLQNNEARRQQQQFGHNLGHFSATMNAAKGAHNISSSVMGGINVKQAQNQKQTMDFASQVAQKTRAARFTFDNDDGLSNEFIPSYANQVWVVGVCTLPELMGSPKQTLILAADKYSQVIMQWQLVPHEHFEAAQEDTVDTVLASTLQNVRKKLGMPTLVPTKLYLCSGPEQFARSTTLSAISRFMEQQLSSVDSNVCLTEVIGQVVNKWNFTSLSQVCRHDLWLRSSLQLAATGKSDIFGGLSWTQAQSLAEAARNETQVMMQTISSTLTPNTSKARKRSNDELYQIVAN